MTEIIFTEKIYEMLKGDPEMRYLACSILKSADKIYIMYNERKIEYSYNRQYRSACRFRRCYNRQIMRLKQKELTL